MHRRSTEYLSGRSAVERELDSKMDKKNPLSQGAKKKKKEKKSKRENQQ